MKPFLLSFAAAAAFGGALFAQAPANYYDGVLSGDATEMRTSVHDLIDDHTRYPYTSSSIDTWDILETAQQDPNSPIRILDVYKNASYIKMGGGVGPYNREHTWPRSYGFPDDNSSNYPFTDCHALFLCDSSYNTTRSNKPYRDCSPFCTELGTDANNGQGGPAAGYPGNSNWTTGSFTSGTWEVWPGRRGDVARALFYLDVRYEGGQHGVTFAAEPDLILTNNQTLISQSNTGNNESVAYMGMLDDLLRWHEEDPPDDFERNRNNVVGNFQGSWNPFVDNPDWVDCIFDNQCCTGLPGAPTFCFDTATISLSTGGTQGMTVNAGAARAGDLYWVLGSASGTSPGVDFGGGVLLPLNVDPYFNLTLSKPFLGIFGFFLGLLDGEGKASPSLTIPPSSDPSLSGVELSHAFLLAETFGMLDFASNAVSVTLVP